MADTFAGQSLQIMTQPLTRTQGSEVNVRHMPGGNISYIDRAGMLIRRMKCALLFNTYADYLLFEGKANSQGTLTYVDGSFTATLENVEMSRRYPDGHIEAQAQFIIG
jgi:hypothetical protein